ncbi:MAG: helix-turn-helix domain-containing protein [Kouleothrix sp.]|jgi:predicted ATPase/class 3 adenylate cyclase|nr:helix-turn-helix domain-containing protein [Kouleothrix sp.]
MERTTSFGYWLRRRRKARDLTQEQLARQAGCAIATIKKIEADERRPSRQLAERFAELLQLAPDERAAFLQAARAELATDQLTIATQPITTPSAPAPAARLPTGTVTFLFTDIEDSTWLWAQHPEGMRAALARHDVLLRGAIEHHGGVVFKTVGDAFYAAFLTATDALAAALDAQRALHAQVWDAFPPDDTQSTITVRMALHTGTAELRDGDYFGHTLNRIARLLTAGHGGQILLSATTWELVRDHLPPDVALRDRGAHWLKSLVRPEQIYQLIAPDLPAEFPPLRTLDHAITNLPSQPTAFIGREKEVAAVRDLFGRDDVRLVTLTGPGGTGKTRLGLRVAAELLDEFPDGVWFVNLAPLSDSSLLAATIAQIFSLREIGGQPIDEVLKHYLRAKRLLLLLDNFEQITAAASLVGELLSAALGLKVLVTSRAPLHLLGEHEHPVPPLGLPNRIQLPDVEQVTQYEAVRLYIERAQTVKPNFVVTNDNAPAVAEICTRLDGLPLAIELAAARIKLFPPQALLARLDKRLQLLTGGARDLPQRQQTIRNTIDWSYQLLDVGEQALFARLGVFVSGCTLEAAEAVCDADGDLPMEIVDGIAALIDKSLLRQEEGVEDEPRFLMLEIIREYALERLEASGEAETMRRHYTTYYLGVAEAAQPQLFYHPESLRWLERLEVEHGNLRAALGWAIERRESDLAVRFGAALGWFWYLRSYWREGLQWLEAALTHSGTDLSPARAYALFHAGLLNLDDGRRAALQEESLALFRKLGDTRGIARVLPWLVDTRSAQGEHARAKALLAESVALGQELGDTVSRTDAIRAMLKLAELQGDYGAMPVLAEEFLALCRQVGEPHRVAYSLNALGETARLLGHDDRAVAAYEEALAMNRVLNNRDMLAAILANMGFVVQRQGDHARAATLFAEALTVNRELELQDGMALPLAGLAGVAAAQLQLERAARLLGAAEGCGEMNNWQMDSTDRADYERIVATTRAQLDEVTFASDWAAGRALTLEQAIAYALDEVDMPAEKPPRAV